MKRGTLRSAALNYVREFTEFGSNSSGKNYREASGCTCLRLVHGSLHIRAGEVGNYAFDLPPVAELDDIASIATGFSAHGGLVARVVAEPVDQFRRIGQRQPA